MNDHLIKNPRARCVLSRSLASAAANHHQLRGGMEHHHQRETIREQENCSK